MTEGLKDIMKMLGLVIDVKSYEGLLKVLDGHIQSAENRITQNYVEAMKLHEEGKEEEAFLLMERNEGIMEATVVLCIPLTEVSEVALKFVESVKKGEKAVASRLQNEKCTCPKCSSATCH